jgi:hypothetical protein
MKLDGMIKIVEKRWEKDKAMLLEELALMMSCSAITVRRRLKKWNSISSYNKNGRYYTLPQIARFNEDGLWIYQGIGFSMNGNLIQTITHLVHSSTAGLYGEDISGMLHSDSYSILAKMMKTACLRREKMYGKFIYFSFDVAKYDSQLCERGRINESFSPEKLSESLGIVALVELIKNPRFGFFEICECLKKQGVDVSEALLRDFFTYHGILKKTRDSRR